MESWKRTLFISLSVIFFHSAALGMLMPFLPLFIRDLGITDPRAQSTWSGILSGSAYLTMALLAPLWGALSDRYGRKPIILRTSLGIATIALLMSAVTNVYQLLVLRILHGVCGAMFPSFVALVSQGVPANRTGRALGTMQASLLAGSIVGPLLGGLLSDLIGYRNVLLVISCLTLLGGLTTLIFIQEIKRDRTSVRATVADNIRTVLGSPDLRIVAVTLFAIQFSLFIVDPILPLFIVSLHGAAHGGGHSATVVGLVFSVTGLSTMLFAPYWGAAGDRQGPVRILSRSLLFAGVAYFPQALVTSAYHLLPIRAVIGFFVAGIVPSTQALIVRNTDDSLRGGVLGITHAVSIFGQALGPLIGGRLGAVFGYRVPFLLTSVLLMTISFVLTGGVPFRRRRTGGKKTVQEET